MRLFMDFLWASDIIWKILHGYFLNSINTLEKKLEMLSGAPSREDWGRLATVWDTRESANGMPSGKKFT
jgi:hypothetical protein